LFAQSRWLLIGSIPLASPASAAALDRAVGLQCAHGGRVVLDVNWRPSFWPVDADAARERLEPLLRQQGIASVLAPDLALEALAELAELAEGKGFSPDPGR
jgi:fructokinase